MQRVTHNLRLPERRVRASDGGSARQHARPARSTQSRHVLCRRFKHTRKKGGGHRDAAPPQPRNAALPTRDGAPQHPAPTSAACAAAARQGTLHTRTPAAKAMGGAWIIRATHPEPAGHAAARQASHEHSSAIMLTVTSTPQHTATRCTGSETHLKPRTPCSVTPEQFLFASRGGMMSTQ
jgi:hypothetical protein